MESEKENYLKIWDREFQTTLKVLKAYPHDKAEMKPAEKSKSARELAWVFASEEKTIFSGIAEGNIDWSKMEQAPPTISEVITAYEHAHKDAIAKIKAVPEEKLHETMKFFVAPKTTGDVRKIDLLWMMLMDQVHHRGQFSVYLRIAGAKVPSIYGPTADEPWN
jgi:uncharacterized damage-inducible protein DinB